MHVSICTDTIEERDSEKGTGGDSINRRLEAIEHLAGRRHWRLPVRALVLTLAATYGESVSVSVATHARLQLAPLRALRDKH